MVDTGELEKAGASLCHRERLGSGEDRNNIVNTTPVLAAKSWAAPGDILRLLIHELIGIHIHLHIL